MPPRKVRTATPKVGSKPTEELPLDPFAALFAGFDADEHYVALHRLEPKEWQDVPIAGYLEKILPGVDEQYLKDRYGGGKFMLQKKDTTTHRIVATRTLDIAGLPKVPLAAPSEPAVGSPASDPVNVKIGGVEIPYSGNLQEMERFMLFVKGLNTAFPEKQDINDTLLKMLLEQRTQPDPLDRIRELKELSQLFETKGGGGEGLYGVIQTAIAEAGGVIQKMMTPGMANLARPGPGVGRLPARKQVALPVKEPGATAELTDSHPADGSLEVETSKQENENMSQQQTLYVIASTIVKAWRLEPPMETPRLIEVIDGILEVEEPVARAVVVSQYSGRVLSLCETELVEDWTDPETKVGTREKFTVYVTDLFTEYGREDRTVDLI